MEREEKNNKLGGDGDIIFFTQSKSFHSTN